MEKKVTKKKVTARKKIKCVTLRRIGLADRTSEVGEEVELDREAAIKLQDANAIKVVI